MRFLFCRAVAFTTKILLILSCSSVLFIVHCITPITMSSSKMRLVRKIYQEQPKIIHNVNNISPYPVDFIQYDIYKVTFKLKPGMDCYPVRQYIALVPDDSTVLFLDNIEDFNRLISQAKVVVTESLALSIAMFYFFCNNLNEDKCRWWVVSEGKQIPGHLNKMRRSNERELKTIVDDRLQFSIRHKPVFWNTMIQTFKRIYIERSLSLDHLISPPSVMLRDAGYTVWFYTWEYPDGCIRKWQICINKQGCIIGYMSKTVAMWVGSWTDLRGFYDDETFDFKWGTVTDFNANE